MKKINEQLLRRSFLVLVLVVVSCFLAAASGVADGNPGSTSSSTSSSSSSSSSGSSGGSSGGAAGALYDINADQFTAGYTKEIRTGDRFRFTVNSTFHFLELTGLTTSTASIKVTSDPQEATLIVGDMRRFEVSDDSFYDVAVTLNNIVLVNGTATWAGLTVQSNSDEVTSETVQVEQEKEKAADTKKKEDLGLDTDEGGSKWWLYVLIAVIVLAAVGFVAYKMKSKN